MPARRFLTRNPANPHAYTSNPLREYPEVADDPDVVARIAERRDIRDEPEGDGPTISGYDPEERTRQSREAAQLRRAREVEQRQQDRQNLDLERRMMEARRHAKARRIDISHELYVIGRLLERAERGGHKPVTADARLASVEARLDQRDLAA